MEHDFERYVHRRRRMQRAAGILAVLVIAAGLLVWLHSCSEQFRGPYDSRSYRPVDVLPQDFR